MNEHYSIRPDFDSSGYMMYEKLKSVDCIFGGEKSPTPTGIFEVEKKSAEEYISGYYPKRGKVKFFGYLVIFEDYFIHSDLYDAAVTGETMQDHEPISKNDTFTSGCIRIAQGKSFFRAIIIIKYLRNKGSDIDGILDLNRWEKTNFGYSSR